MKAYLPLAIEKREDGGVLIHAPGTGLVFSSEHPDEAFRDLGEALAVWWRETEKACFFAGERLRQELKRPA